VTATAAGSLINHASASGNEADPTPSDNSTAFATTVQAPLADLSLKGKTSFPNPLTVGGNLTFTLIATNAGPNTATGVTIADTLPTNVSLVSATGGVTPVNGVLTFNVGTLASGATASVTFVVTATAAGSLINHASASGNEADPTPSDNSTAFAITVQAPLADLSLKGKTSFPNPLTVGANLTFTLIAANAGPNTATAVTITDTLPTNVSRVSATGGVTPVNGVLTFNIGTLASGASASVTFVVMATAAGSLSNQATVTGNEADPTPGDNTVAFASNVAPTPPPLVSGFGAARDAFVITLYLEILGRDPELSALRFWAGLLAGGVGPRVVALAIWDSPEHLTLLSEGKAPDIPFPKAFSDALAAAAVAGRL
jgi:uncharacterized repeat protein (TIGR01451 family)